MRKNIFTKIAAVAAATVLAVTALPALVSDTHAADDEYSSRSPARRRGCSGHHTATGI